jgi:glycyl-tRNA synthetase alpha chain
MAALSFQDIIISLTNYWTRQGCCLLQGHDVEVGAGTLHPATAIGALKKKECNICYVQSSRRPSDARYGENPNRLQSHNQFQVILKPVPDNFQKLYLDSLKIIGVDKKNHDIRFVEDDWENPSIGASGLGWEVWIDGMEITQFTYMQQIGGVECEVIPGEITYGLERLAMYVQGKENVYDLAYNAQGVKYGDIYLENEQQMSAYNLEYADIDMLQRQFKDAQKQANLLLDKKLPLPAYEQCLKASHLLNLIEARGALSVTERAAYIGRVREIVKQVMQ